jgi:hypothetical protein
VRLLINPALDILAPKTPTIGHFERRDFSLSGESIDSTLVDFEEFRHLFKSDYVACHLPSPVSK